MIFVIGPEGNRLHSYVPANLKSAWTRQSYAVIQLAAIAQPDCLVVRNKDLGLFHKWPAPTSV